MTLKGPIHDKNSDVTLSRHKTNVLRSIEPVHEGGHLGTAEDPANTSPCATFNLLLHLVPQMKSYFTAFYGEKSICFGGMNIFWDSKVTNSEDLLYYVTSYLLHPYHSKHSFFLLLNLIQHGTFISNSLCLK